MKWYLFSLVLIPAIMFLGIVVINGGMPTFDDLTSKYFATYPFYLVAVSFGGGPFAEEFGWRGFALPRMQSKFGSLKAALVIGFLWAVWHLPDFLTVAQRGGPGSDISLLYYNLPIFIVSGLAISILLSWVYNSNKGNMFLVMLVHASLNMFSLIQSHLTNPILKKSDLPFTLGFILLALLILIFTRGKLAYKIESTRRPHKQMNSAI